MHRQNKNLLSIYRPSKSVITNNNGLRLRIAFKRKKVKANGHYSDKSINNKNLSKTGLHSSTPPLKKPLPTKMSKGFIGISARRKNKGSHLKKTCIPFQTNDNTEENTVHQPRAFSENSFQETYKNRSKCDCYGNVDYSKLISQ